MATGIKASGKIEPAALVSVSAGTDRLTGWTKVYDCFTKDNASYDKNPIQGRLRSFPVYFSPKDLAKSVFAWDI